MVYNLLQMLYRPSFCANCSDKIERANWGIFTSRRFCDACAAEFKVYDLFPRFVVGIGLLTGIFGLGSYMNSGPNPKDALAVKPPVLLTGQMVPPPRATAADLPPVQAVAANTGQSSVPVSKPAIGSQPVAQTARPKPASEEAVYYCGAETKKGTPCSRRVKGNIRCYQHSGMPQMSTNDDLSIRQQKPK